MFKARSLRTWAVSSVCLILACSAGSVLAGTYYVSPTGTAGNPGTLALPWSLGKANSDLVAGDTAILMDGSYSTKILPSQSGTAGNPITYKAQNSRLAELTTGSPRIEVSNRSYITVDGIKAWTGQRSVVGINSSHITINDCDFSFFNQGSFETNRFHNTGGYITYTNNHIELGTDCLHIREGRGHYIANNTFLDGVHTILIIMGVNNTVVENNSVVNLLPDPVNGEKCMEVFSLRGAYDPPVKSEYNLIQGNYFRTPSSSGIQYAGNRSILRRNIFDSSVRGMVWANYGGTDPSDDPEAWWDTQNRFYNNTIYDCDEAISVATLDRLLTVTPPGEYGDNIMVNNIIAAGSTSKQIHFNWSNGFYVGRPTHAAMYYNNIFRTSAGQDVFYWSQWSAGGYKTVSEIEAAYPTLYANNTEYTPNFTNAAADDFTLQAGSSCIDAGGPLTTTVGSGTFSAIAVADALYFTDGYGVVDADIVRVGSYRAKITSVDYASNILYLDREVTYSGGQPVYADYNDSAPDMGAFESGMSPDTIHARLVFYNDSAWDGNDPAANAADDAAIATNKSALLPNETATFVNYTSYSKGINGLMIDIEDVVGTPTADDFEFTVGNDSNPGLWTPLAASPTISVRLGAGTDGSDRVTIILPNGTASGQWLAVKTKPSSNNGLMSEDLFYFGNAPGETGNSVTDAEVTPTDEIYVRNNPATLAVSSASISHAGDFNRDKKVGPTDLILCRNNGTNSSTALKLISPVFNDAPTVDAGTGSTIILADAAVLDGTAGDDGNPNPPGSLTTTWSKVSGPGSVVFANASAVDTTATFTAIGTYTLQLAAFDGEKTVTDTVEINVIVTTIFFGDDFEDDDLVGWTVLAGSFDTFQFIGETNYEVHATTAGSRMRADLTDTNLSDTAYLSLAVRHTGGAPDGFGSDTGNRTGQIWFVDDTGAGFGLYFILSQDGAGLLDLYTTTDDGATMTFVGSYTAPAAVGGNDLKQMELVYNRVTDQVECIYESTSMGTISSISSAYRNFTRVVLALTEHYFSFGDPVTHFWGQLDVDDIRIADMPRTD